MSNLKYDVCYGEDYTTASGEQKTRWKNVGAVIQTQKGHVLLLDRTFNPAGCKDPEGRGNVLLNLFAPNRDQERQQPEPQGVPDDDIPF